MSGLDAIPFSFSCFPRDYSDARAKFRAAAQAAGGKLATYANPNRGPHGEDLATDTAWFGPAGAARVLVTISATHGTEGFCGSGAQVDWLNADGPARLPAGVAALFVHAINPHGFAWIRRVTEEGVDLNRNHVDFSQKLPANPGYDELRDAFLPRALEDPVFEAAEAKIAAWRKAHGDKEFQIARSGGQYVHPEGIFFGGTGPTWSRRTIERIVADNELIARELIGVVDYHTGLGPYGYGEPICGHHPDTVMVNRAKRWYGESVTEPALGTSSSVPKVGLNEYGWERMVGDKVTFIALEYGTFSPERGRRAMREDHWLHAYGPRVDGRIDWNAPDTQRIKKTLRRQYYPDTDEWREMVLWRSRQILRQALAGLAGERL
ncbi:MAG: DUF2817 domain-containing protein [Alphaproteobacteria bacterium]|nr:DUF2817 domain-containing protein [Alphaproteobacteria bacterium]